MSIKRPRTGSLEEVEAVPGDGASGIASSGDDTGTDDVQVLGVTASGAGARAGVGARTVASAASSDALPWNKVGTMCTFPGCKNSKLFTIKGKYLCCTCKNTRGRRLHRKPWVMQKSSQFPWRQ